MSNIGKNSQKSESPKLFAPDFVWSNDDTIDDTFDDTYDHLAN